MSKGSGGTRGSAGSAKGYDRTGVTLSNGINVSKGSLAATKAKGITKEGALKKIASGDYSAMEDFINLGGTQKELGTYMKNRRKK